MIGVTRANSTNITNPDKLPKADNLMTCFLVEFTEERRAAVTRTRPKNPDKGGQEDRNEPANDARNGKNDQHPDRASNCFRVAKPNFLGPKAKPTVEDSTR
jgi:hypothetical protein